MTPDDTKPTSAELDSTGAQEAGDPVEPESSPSGAVHRLMDLLRWRVHTLLPNILPSPHGDESEYFEGRDIEENEETRLPPGEQVRLNVMWGMEVFTPGEAEQLYACLSRLKWATGADERGALGWVRHQRNYGGGGWYNVGHVSRHGERDPHPFARSFANVPKEADYLLVRIFQLTASLTCVLVGFVMNEEFAQSYANELARDRNTRRERGKEWAVTIVDPWHQKRRSIRAARANAQDMVRSWFRDNLPGFFTQLDGARLPTAELVTTKEDHLLSENEGRTQGRSLRWRRILADASWHYTWTSEDCPGLRFSSERYDAEGEAFHLQVALRTQDLTDAYLGSLGLGSGSPRTYALYCHERLDGILTSYAALAFLGEATKDMRTTRAALKASSSTRRHRVRVLESIHEFFDRMLGTPATATELRDLASDARRYKADCDRFTAPKLGEEGTRLELSEVLCRHTKLLAERLINDEHSTREHLSQLSNIVSVRESVNTQRRMEFLTGLALLVAAASLYVALSTDNAREERVTEPVVDSTTDQTSG